jgi:ABC-type multidrug transport system fused ATPase/permease subunit
VGEFTSVVFLFTLLVFPLRLIGYALSELPRSMAAWQRIHEVIDEPIEPDPRHAVDAAPPGVGVQLDGVSYRYEGDERWAVRDVDLAVPVGAITAIVGPTGSGKSTITDLVVGIVPPTAGEVRHAPGTHCVVFQEAFLMSGTVRDNIELGESFPDEQMWESLRLAAADAFVSALDHGLDTVVGERGVSLSGGQRQRLALARALVRRPALLVLDDTTSALDPLTEATVLDNIRTVLSATTVLMVASRPSTISLADDVVLFVGGRAMAHGTHPQLLAGNAVYRQLVEAFESDRVEAVVPGAAPGGGS